MKSILAWHEFAPKIIEIYTIQKVIFYGNVDHCKNCKNCKIEIKSYESETALLSHISLLTNDPNIYKSFKILWCYNSSESSQNEPRSA